MSDALYSSAHDTQVITVGIHILTTMYKQSGQQSTNNTGAVPQGHRGDRHRLHLGRDIVKHSDMTTSFEAFRPWSRSKEKIYE